MSKFLAGFIMSAVLLVALQVVSAEDDAEERRHAGPGSSLVVQSISIVDSKNRVRARLQCGTEVNDDVEFVLLDGQGRTKLSIRQAGNQGGCVDIRNSSGNIFLQIQEFDYLDGAGSAGVVRLLGLRDGQRLESWLRPDHIQFSTGRGGPMKFPPEGGK